MSEEEMRSGDFAQIKTMSATLKQQFAVLALIRVPFQLQQQQQQSKLQEQLENWKASWQHA